jgi:predicted O-methyltransferase YrrM
LPIGCVRLGSSPLHDIAVIAALTKKRQPREVFEIGTFEGLTTVIFIKNGGPNVQVHTLDLPHDRTDIVRTERSYEAHSIACSYTSGHLIDRFGVRSQTDTLFGDSAVYDFQQYRDRIDLFFVDGAHTEDYVASDTYHAFDSLTPDGWVIWHDCLVPQVLKVLKKVAKFVNVLHISGTNLALVIGKPNPDVLKAISQSINFPAR